MTEKEAEVLVARLMRIWAPHQQIQRTSDSRVECRWRLSFKGYLQFDVAITSLIALHIVQKGTVFALNKKETNIITGCLVYGIPGRGILIQPPENEASKQFATEWMPFFRRGCFLSGCPIECTEHEKLEWTLSLEEQTQAQGDF
jgi:hypothetical protein